MFKFKGYNGKTFEADWGWFVADQNGRSGKIVHVNFDTTLNEQVIVADPGYGIMIELRESQVSFVHPPEA